MNLELNHSLPVSLVITPADGATFDQVNEDAMAAAELLGCTVVFTMQGKLHVVSAESVGV